MVLTELYFRKLTRTTEDGNKVSVMRGESSSFYRYLGRRTRAILDLSAAGLSSI